MSVAHSISQAGGTAITVKVDVVDRASVRTMAAATVEAYGRLDVTFNNAGIARVRKFRDIAEDDGHRVMDANGLGVLIVMQKAIKQVIPRDASRWPTRSQCPLGALPFTNRRR